MDKPKLIKDLGIFVKAGTKLRKRYGEYICPMCKKIFIAGTASVNCGHTSKCTECRLRKMHEGNTKHGGHDSRLYCIWENMKARCNRPTMTAYSYYGEQGIKVCEEWNDSFIAFRGWAESNGYNKNLTIDRIDSTGDYSPINCRWATKVEQSCNTRKIHKTNNSGYRGVSFYKTSNKWKAQIQYKKRHYHLGHFETAKEAALAYDTFIIVYGLPHTQNFT